MDLCTDGTYKREISKFSTTSGSQLTSECSWGLIPGSVDRGL